MQLVEIFAVTFSWVGHAGEQGGDKQARESSAGLLFSFAIKNCHENLDLSVNGTCSIDYSSSYDAMRDEGPEICDRKPLTMMELQERTKKNQEQVYNLF